MYINKFLLLYISQYKVGDDEIKAQLSKKAKYLLVRPMPIFKPIKDAILGFILTSYVTI
jgi:hypothetical protein